MVLTTDIATHLQDDSVGTIRSTDDWGIYENQMPSKPHRCIAIFPYGGMAPDLSWDGEYPSVQVRVRGYSSGPTPDVDEDATNSAEAYNKAYEVMKSLHGTLRTTINDTLYYWMAAKHSPAFSGRDPSGRHIYVINFDIIKEYE